MNAIMGFTCDDLNATRRTEGARRIRAIIHHAHHCEDCNIDLPDVDEAVLADYLEHFSQDYDLDHFNDRYCGTFPSLEEFAVRHIREVHEQALAEIRRAMGRIGLDDNLKLEPDMRSFTQYITGPSGAVFDSFA